MKVLLAFLVAYALLLVGVNRARPWLFGDDVSAFVDVGITIFGTSVAGVLTWLALREEGVRPTDVGLSSSLVVPGVVAVGGVWVGLNAVGVGLAAVTGHHSSIGYLYDRPFVLWVGVAVEQYLFVGILEEFVARGYVQNKLIDLFDGRDRRLRKGVAILAASVVFAATHVPNQLFVTGLAVEGLPTSLAPLVVTGTIFGLVYEFTGNLYLVGLLHGTGNQWLLFVDPGAWPGWMVLVGVGSYVVFLAVVVWFYRRWATGAGGRFTPSRDADGT